MQSWSDVVAWFGNSANLGTILTLAVTALAVIAIVLGVTLSIGRVGKRVRAAHEDLNDRLDALNRSNADIARALRDRSAVAPSAPTSASAPASAPIPAQAPAAAPAPAPAAPQSRAELRATTAPETPSSGTMPTPAAQAYLSASSLDNDPLNQ